MPPTRVEAHFISAFCVFLCLFFCSNTIFASKKEDMTLYKSKLERIQKSISKVQGHLKGDKKQRSSVVTELKKLESRISKNSIKLKQLGKNVEKTKSKKVALENELKELNKRLNKQQEILSGQMRAAYSMGQQQNIKLLLNQQDTDKIGRAQEYFNYLSHARQEQISSFLKTIRQKQQTETKLEATLLTRDKLLQAQKDKKRQRQKQRLKRKNLLTELSSKIKNQESTLSSLQTSRGKIENLLKSLGELLANIPTDTASNFKLLKGKLPWPIKGKFLGKFGQSKHHGGLKWNGVLIKAKTGTPVRTIGSGRVAFSDWLQGFGFITIIDHGNGYMSLYGHNETLFKQSGEWVQAGEVIASAGDSGGQQQSGVYFEIRSRGKPVNPANWCSSSAEHTDQES
jgi:septal ring factor EnvC (AmiA/AmiB activator)